MKEWRLSNKSKAHRPETVEMQMEVKTSLPSLWSIQPKILYAFKHQTMPSNLSIYVGL